jgi:hypothetical protein
MKLATENPLCRFLSHSETCEMFTGILISGFHFIHRALPMAVSGMANKVFSVATLNVPWTDRPTP